MAYREYTDDNGRLHRRHYNGHLFTKPRTSELAPPTPPGDDPITQALAIDKLQALRDRDGEAAYRAWFERTFEQDGHTADDFTWRQILAAALIAIEHPETFECDCNGANRDSCPHCREEAHTW